MRYNQYTGTPNKQNKINKIKLSIEIFMVKMYVECTFFFNFES